MIHVREVTWAGTPRDPPQVWLIRVVLVKYLGAAGSVEADQYDVLRARIKGSPTDPINHYPLGGLADQREFTIELKEEKMIVTTRDQDLLVNAVVEGFVKDVCVKHWKGVRVGA